MSFKKPIIPITNLETFKVRISQIPPFDVAFKEMALTDYENLVAVIYSLNELIEINQKYINLTEDVLEWIISDGLNESVLTQLTIWANDGTLGQLLNDVLFESKLDKTEFNNYKNLVSNEMGQLETNVTNVVNAFKNVVNSNIQSFKNDVNSDLSGMANTISQNANTLNNKVDSFNSVLDSKITNVQNNTNQSITLLSSVFNEQFEQKVDKSNFENQINSKFGLNTVGGIELKHLSNEVKTAITGGSTAVVGINSVGTEEIIDNSITSSKLKSNYNYRGVFDSVNLDTLVSEGNYIVLNLSGTPNKFGIENAYLNVKNINSRFIIQTLYKTDEFDVQLTRLYDVNGSSTPWQPTNKLKYSKYLDENSDLNDYLDHEYRLLALSGTANLPHNESCIIENKIVRTRTKTSTQDRYWGEQTATNIYTGGTLKYYIRRYEYNNGVWKIGSWEEVGGQSSNVVGDGNLALQGKKVVNLGDSIFGRIIGNNSISSHIATRTGATVYNCAFGGTRMANHFGGWNLFSLPKLTDEIIKDNSDPSKWQAQENELNNPTTEVPQYFNNIFNTLKTLDFNNIDYITLNHGTNDFTASIELETSNKLDTNTFAGAMRYALSKIMGKYKHIKVLVITPTYRFWMDNGSFVNDSDVKVYNNRKLIDFVDKSIQIAHEFKTPYLDLYRDSGINYYNKELYFDGNDGTHHNTNGTSKLGSKVGAALIGVF